MKKMQSKKHLSDAGFSLVELLITMLISGIVTVAAVAFLSLGLRYYGNADNEATIQNESQIATMFLTELLQEAKDYKVFTATHPDFSCAFEVIRTKPDPATGDIVEYSSVVGLKGNQLWYVEIDGDPTTLSETEKMDKLFDKGLEGAFLASKVASITLDPVSYSGGASDGLVKLIMKFQVNDRVYDDTAVISLRNKKRN